MVGHESVDPKPQEKSDLVNGVILMYEIGGGASERLRARPSFFFICFIRGACLVKAKGNPVLIPEPGCGYVRRTTN